MTFEFDPEANAIYLRFRAGKVSETIEVAHFVNLDLGEDREPIGLEFVDADAFLPFLRQHADWDELPLKLPRDLALLIAARQTA